VTEPKYINDYKESEWYKGNHNPWKAENEEFVKEWIEDRVRSVDNLPTTLKEFVNYDFLTGKKKNGGLLPLVKKSFYRMVKAARVETEGKVQITLESARRDYVYQRGKWNKKYGGDERKHLEPLKRIYDIIRYSTIPGTSRHHWGTEVDIAAYSRVYMKDKLEAIHYEEGQPFHDLKLWMDANAHLYGFYKAYTDDPNRKGFQPEPWHYSYAPLSKKYLKAYLPHYPKVKEMILADKAIEGLEHFDDVFLDRYRDENLLDINPVLKDLL